MNKMKLLGFLLVILLVFCCLPLAICCNLLQPADAPVAEVTVVAATATADCTGAKNTCADYAPSWTAACAPGARCLTFTNASATDTVALMYQIGCNGDGSKGAPQCDCTPGPTLAPGASMYFAITDGDYASCLPSWTPSCLTAGLAVIAAKDTAACDNGTRIEFTAGNTADPFGHFDSYDVDLEKGYAIPVSFAPNLPCAKDTANHDCRALWCDSATCPDAYATPTAGKCPDGRSPQVGCQDTFTGNVGYMVTYFPATGTSCQDAKACDAAPAAPAPVAPALEALAAPVAPAAPAMAPLVPAPK
jgi:hypothetical protein